MRDPWATRELPMGHHNKPVGDLWVSFAPTREPWMTHGRPMDQHLKVDPRATDGQRMGNPMGDPWVSYTTVRSTQSGDPWVDRVSPVGL